MSQKVIFHAACSILTACSDPSTGLLEPRTVKTSVRHQADPEDPQTLLPERWMWGFSSFETTSTLPCAFRSFVFTRQVEDVYHMSVLFYNS